MPKRVRPYSQSGFHHLKRGVKDLAMRKLDMRTSVGRALADWRNRMVADLGGPENVSTAEESIIDLAAKAKLMLDSIDAWLLTQKSIINKSKRCLIPIVKERTQVADSLARYLGMLGLSRRKVAALTLSQYVEEKSGKSLADNNH